MPAIARIEDIAAKWVRVTPGRSADYEAGVRAPRVDWADATEAAADRWNAGVDRARTEGLFGRGVREAGTARWQSRTLAVGVPRWGPGVAASEEAYRTGFRPYRDVIEAVTLPPKGPRGDPGNIERVRVLAAALYEARVRG